MYNHKMAIPIFETIIRQIEFAKNDKQMIDEKYKNECEKIDQKIKELDNKLRELPISVLLNERNRLTENVTYCEKQKLDKSRIDKCKNYIQKINMIVNQVCNHDWQRVGLCAVKCRLCGKQVKYDD